MTTVAPPAPRFDPLFTEIVRPFMCDEKEPTPCCGYPAVENRTDPEYVRCLFPCGRMYFRRTPPPRP